MLQVGLTSTSRKKLNLVSISLEGEESWTGYIVYRLVSVQKSRMLIRFAPDKSGYPLENIVKKPESCV